MDSFWEQVNGAELRQGDYLLSCPVPVLSPVPGGKEEVVVQVYNLMVLTQSCDLVNAKAEFVALCPVYLLSEFEQANPQFTRKGEWENVRKGRVEGLYLFSALSEPLNNRLALVADFREIYSLPFAFLSGLAAAQTDRWRLKPPYLEHFSQAFARFFMRVGLPSSIPPYK